MVRWLLPGSRPRPATINISIVHCSSSRKSRPGEISALETVYKVDLYRVHALGLSCQRKLIRPPVAVISLSLRFPFHDYVSLALGELAALLFPLVICNFSFLPFYLTHWPNNKENAKIISFFRSEGFFRTINVQRKWCVSWWKFESKTLIILIEKEKKERSIFELRIENRSYFLVKFTKNS